MYLGITCIHIPFKVLLNGINEIPTKPIKMLPDWLEVPHEGYLEEKAKTACC